LVERLPKCTHTCLQCSNAVLYEVYSRLMRKIVFAGCWEKDEVFELVKRENCGIFVENPTRVRRDFWEKWDDNIYTETEKSIER